MKSKLELTKNYRINVLLDFYGSLLTSKQKDYIQQYYGEDYSLGEIADNFNISRQAVYDNIKRTENTLESYEDKLHLYQKFLLKNKKFDKIYNYIHKHYIKDPYLNKLIVELDKLEE